MMWSLIAQFSANLFWRSKVGTFCRGQRNPQKTHESISWCQCCPKRHKCQPQHKI